MRRQGTSFLKARSWCSALAVLLFISATVSPGAASAVSTAFTKKLGLERSEYKVSGVIAAEESEATRAARVAALVAAAEKISGDKAEREAVGQFTRDRALEWIDKMTGPARIVRRMFTEDGEKMRLTILVEVADKDLRITLEDAGVLRRDQDVADVVGNPTILVVSSELDGNNTQRELTQLGHVISDRVASYLTARQWNVVDRTALESARQRQAAMQGNEGLGEDPNAVLAQLSGADIFIVFSVNFGNAGVQATVSVKGYETSTGRLLTSSAKPSRQYLHGTAQSKAAYEALDSAMPTVFEQMRAFWSKAMREGRSFKVVVRADLSDRSAYRSLREALEGLGKFKKTVKTTQTLAGVLTSKADPDDFADDLLDEIRAAGYSDVRFIMETDGLYVIEAN